MAAASSPANLVFGFETPARFDLRIIVRATGQRFDGNMPWTIPNLILHDKPARLGKHSLSTPFKMNDRRSIGRTKIAKGALLFFSGQTGVRSCWVTDITNVGAGIRAQDLTVLPLNFELSFDNFRTIRKCRLRWRDGEFVGVAFES
jgi:hypothetical protein